MEFRSLVQRWAFNAQHAVVRTSDGLRRNWPVVLLCSVFLGAGTVWLSISTSTLATACSKGLQRLFGNSNGQSIVVTPMEVEGTAGSYGSIASFDAPAAGNSVLLGTAGVAINSQGAIAGAYSNVSGVS